jgi:N-acetylglucosamine malate deacetylase 2
VHLNSDRRVEQAVMMAQPLQQSRWGTKRSAHAKLFGTGDFNAATRCTVIVAHPADEIVGAGCLISRLDDVTVVHVTDGARDLSEAKAAGFDDVASYAEARKRECLEALAVAEVPHDRVVEFAVPDTAACECLPDLTKRIASFLQEAGTDIVVTHPYEGGHPDHDATAFATHAALRLMELNGLKPPTLFEMALHPGNDEISKLPEFLPGTEGETTTLVLDARATELKRQMFECLQSQRRSMQASPVGLERFRQPPQYDFSAPPQEGQLHYEKFDWAPRKSDWLSRSRKALKDLFPSRESASQSMQNLL